MNRINKSVTRLFEIWCEVEPLKQNTGKSAVVTRSFPETFRDEKVLNAIGEFAFPCEFEKTQVQVYSFVITDICAQWRFGFCRHDTRSDKATVIVTHLPWHDQFIKFINRLAEVRNNSPQDFQRFLSETYAVGVPDPGSSVTIFSEHERYVFKFEMPWNRELAKIPENHNLSVYYNFVEPEMMIDVFCAMLNERRIIFTSQRLEVLSSCILAAADLIYPMTWQHIYIPVLPMKLKEYVNAPMPFLIGVAKPVLQAIRADELTEVVLLDCDNQRFESQFDDKKSLPRDVLDGLRKNLNNPSRLRGDGVSRTFLRAIVQLIGGYRDGLKFGDAITFDDEQFLEARSPRVRPFLKNILELQLFRQFIDERLISMKDGFSDEFEKEIRVYSEKSSKKKFKLIQNFKEKTNPAISSAMQSAKESGRGVKTVYKGIKSKIKEAKVPSQFRNSTTADTEIRINSAPSSPETMRRDQLDTSGSSENLNRPPLSLSPSPVASRSSSGMNILQELEREGLFHRPEIDRSLKPKQSIIPLTLTPNISSTTSNNNNNTLMNNKNNNNNTNEKPFILKPMVPPRPKQLILAQNSSFPFSIQTKPHPIVKQSSSAGGDGNNFSSITLPDKVYDPFVRSSLPEQAKSTAPPPLPPTLPPRRSHVLMQQQTAARQDFFNNSYEHWQIKAKNSGAVVNGDGVQVIKSPSDDLIKLDDSIELDDFDPLNDNNATTKTIASSPSTSSRSETSSISMLPSTIVGFSNPVYTYNEQPKSSASLNFHAERSESLELLSRYGLDQYTLLANGQISAGIGALSCVGNAADNNNGQQQTNTTKNWTTFE